MTKKPSDRILERLLSLHPKIIDLSLDRMYSILEKLGNPQNHLPPTIHVAGTNGKGSTVAYLRSILEASNLSVHVYTSPHLVNFAERIRVSGKIISEDYLSELLEFCEKVNDGEPITYFEITTAAAFKAFADNPADVLILEVGLGGRLDATNVVDHPLGTVITPVSLDHEQFLGSELSGIAMEKASIAKKDVPLISALQHPDAWNKINEIAVVKGANLITEWHFRETATGFCYSDSNGSIQLPKPNLIGPHQISNAALAIATLRHQDKFTISDEEIIRGIQSAIWPARMQNITVSAYGQLLSPGSELWLDGGHNPAAGDVISNHFKDEKIILICGMLQNKDTRGYLANFTNQAKQLFAVHVEGEISHPATDIVKFAWDLGIKAETAQNVKDALQKIGPENSEKVLICGSLYLAGKVLADNNLIPE
ncbi:MAG: folylpolyglutamate synthase/dihydrofolate synthase family protein [Emcibacteraceae bacterium]